MLISANEVLALLQQHGITPTGALHIGAHDCEEFTFYRAAGLADTDVYWVDAIQEKVDQNKQKGVANIVQAVVSDTDDQTVTFKITNNVQSSSILEFGTHADHYAWCKFVSSRDLPTTTVDTLVKRHGFPIEKLNVWNFDIQGAELLALKGATDSLRHAQALYLEVNTEHVYKGCALLPELDAFLKELGFERVRTEMTNAGWGDALWVRK
jgi:FkbM family methyltransferase